MKLVKGWKVKILKCESLTMAFLENSVLQVIHLPVYLIYNPYTKYIYIYQVGQWVEKSTADFLCCSKFRILMDHTWQ